MSLLVQSDVVVNVRSLVARLDIDKRRKDEWTDRVLSRCSMREVDWGHYFTGKKKVERKDRAPRGRKVFVSDP